MKLNIWRFTDGKPGHDAQSNGLCMALGELSIRLDDFKKQLNKKVI